MTKEDIYKSLHATFIDVTKLKKGDTVKITKSFEGYQDGCNLYWNRNMIKTVGKTGTVMGVEDKIEIRFDELDRDYVWCFPYFCVEIVEEVLPDPIYLNSDGDYKAEFKHDGAVVVGCQRICFNVLESIYETAKELYDKN
jgi:hypothetical protein